MHGWMDEYSALAQRISVSVADVRGCLDPVPRRDGPRRLSGRRREASPSRRGCGSSRSASPSGASSSSPTRRGRTCGGARTRPSPSPSPACVPVSWSISWSRRCSRPRRGGRARDTLRVPDAANAPSGKSAHLAAPRRRQGREGAKEGKDGKDGKGKDKDRDRDRTKPVEVAADAAPARGAWSRGTSAIASDDPAAPVCRSVGRGSSARCGRRDAPADPRRGAPTGARCRAGDGAQEAAAEADRERFRRRRGGDGGRPGPAGQRVLGIASAGRGDDEGSS